MQFASAFVNAPFILDEKSSHYIWSTESSQEQRESMGHGFESRWDFLNVKSSLKSKNTTALSLKFAIIMCRMLVIVTNKQKEIKVGQKLLKK